MGDFRDAPPGGGQTINATYVSIHGSVSIGCFRDTAVHPGSGADEWLIESVKVYARPLTPTLNRPLVFVDVGAEGGLQEKWLPHMADLEIVFVEPSHHAAGVLRQCWPQARVIEVALLDQPGQRSLNVTRLRGCTSLLEPDLEVLKRWTIAPAFDVIDRVDVRCDRYDQLYATGAVPLPDILKIDVQGVEYEVLEGFGDLLHDVVAIELEAQFYSVYKGQKLLNEIVAYLFDYGLTLRKLEPQWNFDGDLVEVNAFFTRLRTH